MPAILGALFAVLIGIMSIRPYVNYEHQGMVNTEVAATAGQQRLISTAAQEYIQQNYAAVEAASTATTPAIITVAMLENTGMLPSSVSATNPYGQTWEVQVLQPTTGNLQALVTSIGGNAIPQSQAPAIAAQTGQQGGFIPYSGQYGSMAPTIAEGAYGGWSVSMNGYANPGAGHLASLVAFTNGNLENDYLYRVAVPGDPAVNTMQTNINMGTNNITNATSYATTNSQVVAENETNGTGNVQATAGDGKSTTALYSADGESASVSAQAGTGADEAYLTSRPDADGSVAVGPEGVAESLDYNGTLFSGVSGSDGSGATFLDGSGTSAILMESPSHNNDLQVQVSNSGSELVLQTNGAAINPPFFADSTGESGVSKQFDLPTNSKVGGTCTPNGAITSATTGTLLSCVGGVWQSAAGFSQEYQVGASNGQWFTNSGSTPMFVSTYCVPTPASNGYTQNISIDVYTPSVQLVGYSEGQDGSNGSDVVAPSTSVMVPPGDIFLTSGINANCSLLISQ
jgi:hypothetical protein